MLIQYDRLPPMPIQLEFVEWLQLGIAITVLGFMVLKLVSGRPRLNWLIRFEPISGEDL